MYIETEGKLNKLTFYNDLSIYVRGYTFDIEKNLVKNLGLLCFLHN